LNGGSKSSWTVAASGCSRYAGLQKSGVNIRKVWRASLITDSAMRQRLRMRVPLAAIGVSYAVSRADVAAYSCEVLQMPQIRGAMTSESAGSRPTRICSKPRNIVPTHHASVTVFPSSSSRTSMSPSTRLSSMRIVRR
jgi:hypothetical protein